MSSVEEAPATVVSDQVPSDSPVDDSPPAAVATAEPKVKKKAAPRKPRSAPAHPPYLEMITDAVVTLKERTGSSQQAIQKFIENKEKNLSASFRKLLLTNLKKAVADGKLVKVKASYKLPSTKKPTTIPKPKSTKKPTAAAKPTKKPAAAAAKPKSKAAPKAKAAAAVKPKAKEVVKAKAKPATKLTKTKAVAKLTKPAVKTKAKAVTKPAAKAARTSTRTSPGKKAAPAAKPKVVAATKGKKAAVGKRTPARKAKK